MQLQIMRIISQNAKRRFTKRFVRRILIDTHIYYCDIRTLNNERLGSYVRKTVKKWRLYSA